MGGMLLPLETKKQTRVRTKTGVSVRDSSYDSIEVCRAARAS